MTEELRRMVKRYIFSPEIPEASHLFLIIFFKFENKIVFFLFLQTVLEGNNPPSAGDDDFELWDQSQMLRAEQQGPVYK